MKLTSESVVLRGNNYNNTNPAGYRWDDNVGNSNNNKGVFVPL